jgi:PAS domain S-box-containing protein
MPAFRSDSPPAAPALSAPVVRQDALQAGLDLIDQGFTLIDSELRMVAWNRTFLHLLDFPDTLAYPGAPFEAFMRFNAERGEYGPGDADQQVSQRMATARSFEPHEFERTRPGGTVLRVRGVPVPGHGFVTLYSDVTAQRAAERQIQQHAAMLESRVAERTAELHRSESQMRLITDSIPALIAYFDRERNYRYINRGYQDWFGLDPSKPEAVSAKAYLGPVTYAGIRHNVALALAGEAVTFEYDVTVVSGRQLIARTTLIPEVDGDGRVIGCFELTFDITEQKRSQAMLVQAQKMEALGQLTGGLAHDFNNILTVVIGNLSALCRLRGDDEAMAEYVEPALDAAQRGTELIKSLLSFSRKQPLEAQAVDVGPLIASVGRLVRRSLPESLALDMAERDAPLWAWADPQQLQNSLLNLIINARDATPHAHGRIVLSAAAQRLDTAQALALQVEPGDYVCLQVQDNGQGMAPATVARVYEPFFTTKRPGQGTGLGMAMVYGFVKQSGGAIGIDSHIGAGTTVSLWLPASEAGAPIHTQEAAPGDDQVPKPRGLALLVDDDPAVRSVVRRLLLEMGHTVVEADNGMEALGILNGTPQITLVLTDMVMPGNVDGRAVARHAREHCGVKRVAMMSGYDPDPSGADDLPILAKPFSRAQLAAWLDAADQA